MAAEKSYDYKMIIGARRVRVVVYEDGVMEYPKEAHSTISDLPDGSDYAESNYKARIKTRRNSVESLIYNNFTPPNASIFALTFNPQPDKDAKNLDYTHSVYKKFIQRMNYNYDGFRYVTVFSRQDNGNWHYHMVSNLNRSCKNKDINLIWGQGRTWVNYIETDEQLRRQAKYCLKNMELASKDDLRKEKGYLCSKGLQKEFIFKSWEGACFIPECKELFEEIKNAPHRLLYQTSCERGVKRAGSGVHDGLTEYQEVRGEDAHEIKEHYYSEGYEPWETNYYYVESSKRFPELFEELSAATKKSRKSIKE